jgi:4-amino-4-deoxy-L-arabinose transferase-like glycosyltransferase
MDARLSRSGGRTRAAGRARFWPILVCLPLAFALVAGRYSVAVPPWEAPDEPAHFAYATHLLDAGALPRMVADGGPTEAHQPPLYYLLAAALMAPLDRGDRSGGFEPNPRFVWAGQGGQEPNVALHGTADTFPYAGQVLALHVARLASVLAGALAVAVVVLLARALLPGRPSVALLAGGLVAFNPQFAFIGGVLSNDSLTALTCAAAALAAVRAARAPERAGGWLALGGLVGLALLTKLTAVFLVPLVGLTVLALAVRARSPRLALRAGAAAGGPVALLCGWWFARNQLIYGDPLGHAVFREIHAWNQRFSPVGPADLAAFAGKTFRSFWGTFGWMTIYLPEWMYALALALSAFGLLWFLPALALWRRARLSSGQLLGLGWLATFVLAQGLLLGTVALACGESCYQGRYLFAAIAPIALLIAFGILAPAPERLALPLASIVVVGLCANALHVLEARVRPSYEMAPLTKTEARSAPANVEATIGEQFQLQGYEVAGGPASGTLLVTLYWRALGRPTTDYSAFVHLIDAQGNILAQKDQPPGATSGRLPTEWATGDVVRDTHAVALPDDLTAFRLRVGLYDVATGAQLPVVRYGREAGTYLVLASTTGATLAARLERQPAPVGGPGPLAPL